VRPAQKEQKRCRRTEKLREIDEEMLVSWMYAMLSKVRGIRVVTEIIERCDDGAADEFGKGEFAGGIKRRVYADSKESCEESERCKEGQREWSVAVSEGQKTRGADLLALEVG